MYIDKGESQPHDLDAEMAVLGSLLIDTEAVYQVVPWLKAEHFYREKHRWTYECCMALYEHEKPINQVLIAHELARQKKLDASGGAAYLSHLVSQVPTSVHIKYYAEIVKDLAGKRKLIVAANQIAELGYSDDRDALRKAEETLAQLREGTASKVVTPTEWQAFAFERYATLSNQPGAIANWGIPSLDRYTGGLFKGRLTILAARTSIGKTTLLLQFCNHAAINGNILLATAEESLEDITDKIVAGKAGLANKVVNAGEYSEDVYGQIYDAVYNLKDSNIFIYSEGGMTTEGIGAVAGGLKGKYGLKGIFIDYLQILRDKGGKGEAERIEKISKNLQELARVSDLPVVAACQLNRLVEHGDKVPRLHDLRYSGALEQDADLVLLLYRADAYPGFADEKCPAGQAHLIVAKQRHGGNLGKINLIWRVKEQEYGELER